MRIIFVTPLLWKRLDRAVRRREEGQALILVALATIAMVAIVGLAVDGGLAYLESQKLQRAADAASLAGVVWVPTQKNIADGRGKLSANANGYKVYRKDANGKDVTDTANNWTYDEVIAGLPGERVYYYSEVPRENQYKVTLGRKAQRFFLGVIGLGDYYIQRTSTAEYSRLVKLGSSFNYLGSAGVLYDPSVNATDDPNQTYRRYVDNRCNQPSPPTPCVGVFWSNIGGTDWGHANGDAYNPIFDGQNPDPNFTKTNIGRWSYTQIKTDLRRNNDCDHNVDPISWFTDNNPGAGNGFKTYTNGRNPGSCTSPNPSYLTNNPYPPSLNNDIHPDSGQHRNFGYEIGIQVDGRALIQNPTAANHTNVNISIFDAAMAPPDGTETFGASDSYSLFLQRSGNFLDAGVKDSTGLSTPETEAVLGGPLNGSYPLSPFYPQHYATATPYTGTVKGPLNNLTMQGVCPAPGGVSYPAIGTYANTGAVNQAEAEGKTWRRCLSQYWVTDTNTIASYNPDTGVGLNFGTGQPYRKNEVRTRYTLYWPPQAPGLSSVYANVASDPRNRIGAFEVGDMSLRLLNPTSGTYPPNGSNLGENYTTLVPIERAVGQQDGTNWKAASQGAFTDNKIENPITFNSYCYVVSLNPPAVVGNNPASGLPNTTAAAGVAPSAVITPSQPGYTPALTTVAPWNDTQFVYACPGGMNISFDGGANSGPWAQDYYWGKVFPSGQFNFITSTTSYPMSNTRLVQNWVNDASTFYKVKPSNTDYLDPSQECRISVGSSPARGGVGVIDKQYTYGSPRMPYNAAYGDRINYYDVTKGTWQYWSRHGWRCNWDFDSDYDPRFNPLQPGSNIPLDASNGIASKSIPAPKTNNGTSYYGNGAVEPFFHLTDWTWDAGGNKVLKKGSDGQTVVPGSNNAWVRPGTYMLHVQTYGGSGANRYSVKAEYENSQNVTVTVGYTLDANGNRVPKTTTVVPVPNVFGITTFSIYTNAQNPNTFTSDVLFDLAFIPPENAGSTAILQLWDPGDVAGELRLSLREPSPAGNRLTNAGKVAIGNPITVSVQSCPYYLNNISNCKSDPSAQTKVDMNLPSATPKGQYFNDQWVYMIFQIPNKQAFDNYLSQCNANNVPEEACYYFQVDYELGTGIGNDTTTWQLVVQGAPVRLLK